MASKKRILLIYTGGTIGMAMDPHTQSLRPFDFEHLEDQIPELNKFDLELKAVAFENPIDSSNVNPEHWKQIARIIEERYDQEDGFVILHGSDTMSFTASALSFMLEGLTKPVILTGSQLPIGQIRTDGKENLITAIEIAAAERKGKPVIPEVAVLFEDALYRGNRTHKSNTEYFEAFGSPNCEELARVGIEIKFNYDEIYKPASEKLTVHYEMDCNIQVLHLFPGISEKAVRAVLETEGLKGLVLLTFGSGNAPTEPWFIELLKQKTGAGVVILNVSQCESGSVKQGRYETSRKLKQIGVLSGYDITFEAAVTKMMHLLGQQHTEEQIRNQLTKPIRGEMTKR